MLKYELDTLHASTQKFYKRDLVAAALFFYHTRMKTAHRNRITPSYHYLMKKYFSLIVLFLVLVVLMTKCDKIDTSHPNAPLPQKSTLLEQTFGQQGGELATPQGIKITVPRGALKDSARIAVKPTDDVLHSTQQMRSISRPFVISVKTDTLNAPLSLHIPIDRPTNPKNVVVIARFKGNVPMRSSTYQDLEQFIVLKHSMGHNSVDAELGYYKSNLSETLSPSWLDYRIDVLEVESKKLHNSLGLLYVVPKVPFTDNLVKLEENYKVKAGEKVLVLVHGWTSDPRSCWTSFINYLAFPGVHLYDKVLTFGYNTGLHIDTNGKALADNIKRKLKGAKVDIVAHSMGGLVARSAIENHNAADNVRSLITLGTPHRGTLIASTSVDNIGSFLSGINSDGGNDLSYSSEFIKRLEANSRPSQTNYHFFAGGYYIDPFRDGAVHAVSALDIPFSDIRAENIFKYNSLIPHTALTEDTRVFKAVLEKLKEFEGGIYSNTVLSDDFNGSKLDLNKWKTPTFPSAVKVQDGILKMEQNSTDAKIELLSKHHYRATQRITISRKVALYPASDNFFPYMSLVFDNHKELIIEYSQHSYANKHGLYVICLDKQSEKHLINQKISSQVFNTWFSEKCEIDVARNELKYYRDGQLLGTVQLKGMSLSAPFFVRMHPYGWYTGHKHYMDDFKLEVK